MKKFIRKAIAKLPKLTPEQVRDLIDELARENDMLQVVMDSMEDGIIVCDLEYRVQFVNKTIHRLLPLQKESEDRLLWAVIKDHDIADYLELHMKRSDRILDDEFYVQKGSMISTLAISVYPLVRNRSIGGSIILCRDITEKKKNEAKFRRAENLASLTTLAASVAHEIKNPLASMGIHLQLMQGELARENCIGKESASEYLDIIAEEIERLNTIVVDFLFAVRPMDTRMRPENLNELMQELLDFIKYELEAASISYELQLEERLPKVQIDKKYLKQALLNIIKNAIAAMSDGGQLVVKTSIQGGFAAIDITDDGIGIPEDQLNKIFEPYYTTKDFGSGLGLTVVYKVVREHGGEISLDSQEGKGTTFTILLPLPQTERALINWQGEGDEHPHSR